MMKYKILAMLLTIFCLLGMAACGAATSVASVPSENGPESFGYVVSDLPSAPAATESQTSESETSADDASLTQAKDLYDTAAISAILVCDAVDGLSYSTDDPIYFWRAIGYLAGLMHSDQDTVSMTAADVERYAGTLFPLAFAHSSDWPALTEEDPLVSRDGDNYLVHLPDISSLTFDIRDAVRTEDGAYTAQAEIFREGESLGRYSVSLTDYTGPDSGRSIFNYSILGLTSSLT